MTAHGRNDAIGEPSASRASALPETTQQQGLSKLLPNTSLFNYTALKEAENCIRLVRINPVSNDDDLVRCYLRNITFGERPQYEALSYMWGDDTVKQHILLNDATFDVSANLSDALHWLRQQGKKGWLWINAVCTCKVKCNVGVDVSKQLTYLVQPRYRLFVISPFCYTEANM
ncbi:uncharacterized protein B0I36DRAFT_343244 [Microdochium trichocladiopsis]|uniref:Heterokaryon incompatibility domain-containing protein n=1 Tax=Microdochium trichocladiopsis TaxID=1682393 RepID=A0A9P8XS17_9PEZI|nr:uncharacterized protein B0I36DRAFT_343244 [Microdochium trichocladiopsis]KAH7007904.1 hypothetical protein B0I36DRAFT_343244 [Microdochium trichocladiopsis]